MTANSLMGGAFSADPHDGTSYGDLFQLRHDWRDQTVWQGGCNKGFHREAWFDVGDASIRIDGNYLVESAAIDRVTAVLIPFCADRERFFCAVLQGDQLGSVVMIVLLDLVLDALHDLRVSFPLIHIVNKRVS